MQYANNVMQSAMEFYNYSSIEEFAAEQHDLKASLEESFVVSDSKLTNRSKPYLKQYAMNEFSYIIIQFHTAMKRG